MNPNEQSSDLRKGNNRTLSDFYYTTATWTYSYTGTKNEQNTADAGRKEENLLAPSTPEGNEDHPTCHRDTLSEQDVQIEIWKLRRHLDRATISLRQFLQAAAKLEKQYHGSK